MAAIPGAFVTSTSSTLAQVVAKASSSTLASADINPSVIGQNVTFTATVTAVAPGAGVPSGTVTFKDGTVTLGTGNLNGSGVATFASSALVQGSHNITITYPGDGNFTGGTSNVLVQIVHNATSAVALGTSVNPSKFGQAVTFTAAVTAVNPGAGTPSGLVTFVDGSTAIGTGTMTAGVATFTAANLSVGAHNITAVYGGDANFTAAVSTTTVQNVNLAVTTVTVASATNPSVVGQTVLLTATLSVSAPGSGIPSGTITFKDGVTTLGTSPVSNGTVTFSTSGLALGAHTLTVSYSGDASFASSLSASLTQNVNQDGTVTSLTSSANPSVSGQTITYTASVIAAAPGAGIPSGTITFKGQDW